MVKRVLVLFLIAVFAVSAYSKGIGIKDGKYNVKNKLNDRRTSASKLPYSGLTHTVEYDKAPNGYGWYQGYNRKIQLNSDPANPLVGSIYRKLNESTGSGTIGGMTGQAAISGGTFLSTNSLLYDYSTNYLQNPGGRYPYVCEFINGYLFGVFNDYEVTGDGSVPMFVVGDINYGYDTPIWSAATKVSATEGGATVYRGWTGSGDVVYDPISGYYYWSQSWNEDLVTMEEFVLGCVVGRTLTPEVPESWEWTDYNDLEFDCASNTVMTIMNDISFSYCKDTEGNGTGYGIALSMTNEPDDVVIVDDSTTVELNPRISYMYTTNWGADDSSGDWKPNWITEADGSMFQLDPKDIFDWYGTQLSGAIDSVFNMVIDTLVVPPDTTYVFDHTDTTSVVFNDPFITYNISSVATENNVVHVLIKAFGGTYEGSYQGYLLYENDDDLVLGYYHLRGQITDTGVLWSPAHFVGSVMGFEDFDPVTGDSNSNIDWVYSNFNTLSIGYAGHGVVYAGWMDRPVNKVIANEWPEPDTDYWQDGFFTVSGDDGSTWDTTNKVVELYPTSDPDKMYNLHYASNVTKTGSLHDEGWTLASRGKVSGGVVTAFATNQYYDVANPLAPPVNNFFDHQQFLKAWKISGTMSVGIEAEDYSMVKDFTLSQNYPNPFNPSTEIRFALQNDANVKLSVFNTKGEMVADLKNEKMAMGSHAVNFDASSLNSGVYFYKLDVNGRAETKKMVLTK